GATPTLVKSLSDWRGTGGGPSALMICFGMGGLGQPPRAGGPVMVVGVGPNSGGEEGRKEFEEGGGRFVKLGEESGAVVRQAEDLLDLLRQRGAQKIVWLTLREPTLDLLPNNDGSLVQYREWCWWFPYVNERLQAIKQQHPEMALADWTTVARRPGITYDSIH